MPSEVKITHVIFDMDGLLLDTEVRYEKAMDNVTQKYGKAFTFNVKQKIMGTIPPVTAKIVCDELSLPITPEEFNQQLDVEYQKIFSQVIPMMPGAERLVRHLHAKGVPIAIGTSSKGFTFRLKTKPHQEVFSLFHHVVIASEDPDVTAGKPHPSTFLVAASRFDTPPTDMSTVIVFEDSVAGVQAGNAAGMKSIWVPDPRMPRDAVVPYLTLNSLEEFKPEQFGLPAYD